MAHRFPLFRACSSSRKHILDWITGDYLNDAENNN